MEETETTSAPNAADVAREAALAAFDEVLATEASEAPAAAPEPAKPAAEPAKAAEPAATLPNPAEVAVAEKIAELVRAESALVAKQQAMKAEADAARAEAKAAADKLAAIEAQLAENPMELLRARKWELEDIVKVAATKQTPEAVRIAKLEAAIAERDRKEAEAAQQRQAVSAQTEAEQARTKLINEYIPAQLAIAKDELPLCSKWFEPDELAREVYAVMGHEYSKTKVALAPEEAARRVEAALRKRVEKVNPSSLVTQDVTKQPKPKQPTVKPSATVTNSQTQHRTTADEQVKPGDLDGYRRQALALFDELTQ
jgi:hypothetical protein